MTPLDEFLPGEIVDFIRGRGTAEFATVSKVGLPIDTPTFVFPSGDLTTLDVGTGVAYPAKAERARRNPKAGLLIEGGADEPVISVAGYASVRDADLQANLNRYLAETIFMPNVNPDVVAWEKTRRRQYYLTRIIVAVAPCHVRWWPDRKAMDGAPREWRAPADTSFPASDPAPGGKPSPSPCWPQQPWQALADGVCERTLPAHLTLCDDEGFPLPLRVKSYRRHLEGFSLEVPGGAPWREGQATLSFFGKEIFVGSLRASDGGSILRVERALPILPMMNDRTGMAPEVLDALNRRMQVEVARRGQSLPAVPEQPPEPTEGARLREVLARAVDPKKVGAGISEN